MIGLPNVTVELWDGHGSRSPSRHGSSSSAPGRASSEALLLLEARWLSLFLPPSFQHTYAHKFTPNTRTHIHARVRSLTLSYGRAALLVVLLHATFTSRFLVQPASRAVARVLLTFSADYPPQQAALDTELLVGGGGGGKMSGAKSTLSIDSIGSTFSWDSQHSLSSSHSGNSMGGRGEERSCPPSPSRVLLGPNDHSDDWVEAASRFSSFVFSVLVVSFRFFSVLQHASAVQNG